MNLPEHPPQRATASLMHMAEAAALEAAAAPAMEMNSEELRVIKAYCERVCPPGRALPSQFGTREAFAALTTAFSFWCAEALVTDKVLPHQELLMRSALFNGGLALEMKRRYAELAAANEQHIAQLAAARVKLELIHTNLLRTPTKKRMRNDDAEPVNTPAGSGK